MIFLVLSGKMVFFSKNLILLFRWKLKDDLSQTIHRNMIFSVYLVKMVFFFPTNMYYPSAKKPMTIFSQKNKLKDGISSIF